MTRHPEKPLRLALVGLAVLAALQTFTLRDLAAQRHLLASLQASEAAVVVTESRGRHGRRLQEV